MTDVTSEVITCVEPSCAPLVFCSLDCLKEHQRCVELATRRKRTHLKVSYAASICHLLNELLLSCCLSHTVIEYSSTIAMRPCLIYPSLSFADHFFGIAPLPSLSKSHSLWNLDVGRMLVKEGIILGWTNRWHGTKIIPFSHHRAFRFVCTKTQWQIVWADGKFTDLLFKNQVRDIHTWDLHPEKQILAVLGDNKLYLFWYDELLDCKNQVWCVTPFWNQVLQKAHNGYGVAFDRDHLVLCKRNTAEQEKAIQIWEFV